MVIRTEQMDVHREERGRQFDQKVLDHLRRCFPLECAGADPAVLQQQVDDSFAKAREYGFESEWELVRYLDLEMTLGRGFEQLPRYSEVARHLKNTDLNARTRITQAYAAAHDIAPESAGVS